MTVRSLRCNIEDHESEQAWESCVLTSIVQGAVLKRNIHTSEKKNEIASEED